VQLAVGEPAAEAVDADPADEREAGDEEHDQRGAGEQELGAPRDDDADVVEGGEPDHDDRAPEDGGVEGEGAELDRAREVLAEQHGELVAGDADGHRRERAREGREELQPAGGEGDTWPISQAKVGVVAARLRQHRAELGDAEGAAQRREPAEQPDQQEIAGAGELSGDGRGGEEDPDPQHRAGDDRDGRREAQAAIASDAALELGGHQRRAAYQRAPEAAKTPHSPTRGLADESPRRPHFRHFLFKLRGLHERPSDL
jgi:hypothetical protein